MKRQLATALYERLLLSDGKMNKERVLALAEKGIEMIQPVDMIKDPYVFEFWSCRKISWLCKVSLKMRL